MFDYRLSNKGLFYKHSISSDLEKAYIFNHRILYYKYLIHRNTSRLELCDVSLKTILFSRP